MGLRSRRLEGLGCALLLCTTSLLAPPDLQAAEKLDFRISGGNAAETLNEFGRQARVQLLFDFDAVRGLTTRPVAGELEAADALSRMLEGTGLSFEFVNERTVAITNRLPARHGAPPPRNPEKFDAWQSTAPESSQSLRFVGTSVPEKGARQIPSSSSEQSSGRSVLEGPITVEEVVVTGSHIRGAAPAGFQVITIDREKIDQTGHATVQDVVRALPQNFGGGPSEDTRQGEAATNASRGTALNLRGLGAGATLVLLNGRRMAPGGGEGTYTDVSSIPLTAIERIDVLPDGASALYGSDAVGGVVNFILRSDYQGAETRARIGTVTSGGSREYQIGQTFGTSWSNGNGLLSYEYWHRDSLPASSRIQTASSDLRPLGGSQFGNLFNNPGTISIGGRTWAIPQGQDGTALTAADLIEGTANISNLNEGRDLLGEQSRHNLLVSGEHEVSAGLTLFLDALFARRDVEALNPGFPINLTVPSTNPFYVNPTGGTGPIRVAYNFLDDLGPRALDVSVDTYNASTGFSIDFPRSWRMTVQGTHALEKLEQLQDSIDQAALAAALADPDPATALNPFGDGSFTNPETLASLRSRTTFLTDSELWLAGFTVDGPILQLPAGALRLAAGADYRRISFESTNRVPGVPDTTRTFDRNVSSVYGELFVPIVDDDNARRGLSRLSMSVAARHEKYSDFGSSTTPRFGLTWAPSRGLALRATWSEAFRAPNLADLDESNSFTFLSTAIDPSSPTGVSPVLIWQGKNRDLDEETATIWSAGVDLTPEAIPGLRLGATYFDIEYEDRILAPLFAASTPLDNPQLVDIVIRNPSAAVRNDVCSRSMFVGAPGDCQNAPIAAIVDTRVRNTAITRSSGIDVVGEYTLDSDVGSFSFSLNASYLLEFSQAQTRTSPLLDLVDTATNPIDFRARGSVSWRRNSLSGALFVNYADRYLDNVSQPNRAIESWTTLDLQLSYAWVDAETHSGETGIALNVLNAFDEHPPFFNNPAGIAYDPENADLLGRFVGLQLRRRW